MQKKNFALLSAAAIMLLTTSCSKLGALSADNFSVVPNPLETQAGQVPATINGMFPEKYMKKAYIQKCRIFFTASNVFCATKYSGSDPEVDARSKNNPLTPNVDFSAFPKNRAFNFGLNLSF